MPGRTILVIDYDPQSVESTRKSLVDAGYRVEVATDGIEGLEAFERTRPDLVLIEPMVPKKHGFQVCREIKGSSRGTAVPVLITTAFYKGRRHRATAREQYGCDDYLEKPIAQDDLLAACRRWVDERSGAARVPRAEPLRSEAGPIALDELTDDEIVARLDAMIEAATSIEESPDASAPAAVVPDAPVPLAAPARPVARTAKPQPVASRPATIVATVAPVQSPTSADAGVRRPEPARPGPAESRARSAQASALESGTTRAILSATRPADVPRAAASSSPGRATLLLAGAAVLAGVTLLTWRLTRPVVTEPIPEEAPSEQAVEAVPLDVDRPTDPIALETSAQSIPAEPVPAEPILAPAADGPADGPADETPGAVPAPPRAESAIATRESGSAGRAPQPEAPSAPPVVLDEPAADSSAAIVSESEPSPAEVLPVEPTAAELAPVPTPGVERGTLFALSDVDDAPVPIRKDAPSYPPMARNMRQQGTVTLRVLVGDSGGVEQVEVLRGVDSRLLDDAAKRAVRGWRYRPATVGGVAVRVWITEQVVFRL